MTVTGPILGRFAESNTTTNFNTENYNSVLWYNYYIRLDIKFFYTINIEKFLFSIFISIVPNLHRIFLEYEDFELSKPKT